MELTKILEAAVKNEASDIVLKDGRPPMVRVKGDLTAMPGAAPMTGDDLQSAANEILRDDTHRIRFTSERHADLAFDQPGLGRFRVNVFRQRGKVGIVFRVIPATIRSIAELNLLTEKPVTVGSIRRRYR